MNLEVGMYARYNGKIGKITHICKCEQCKARGYYEPVIEYIHGEDEYVSCYFKNNLKASHNIIDLIEEGDYVNESKVVYFMIDADKSINEGVDEKVGVVVEEEWEGKKYLSKDIKSIVTKEQFESMSYKIGDKK